MHLRANTLDDLLDKAFRLLLKSKMRVSPTKGNTVEEHGVVLELTRPRARLSRAHEKGHVFSCVGELFWYISCKNDLPSIQYYIPRYNEYAEDDGTIWGAYGPRIFGGERSQYEVVRDRLRVKKDTRKAVIQLYSKDYTNTKMYHAHAHSNSWCVTTSYILSFTCVRTTYFLDFPTTYSPSP